MRGDGAFLLLVFISLLGLGDVIQGAGHTPKKRLKENKARPVFTRCEPAFLYENSPARTYVATVEATDEDSQELGDITYQMVGLENKLKFNVDPINGTITSDYIFNRDEPDREKVAFVNVKATDNGSPPLQAICRFNVTIMDKNDNAPIFDKVSYEASVPRDMAINQFVMKIAADDVDLDNNSRITYGLVALDDADQGFFDINNVTGTITLVKSIPQLEGYEFDLRGTATDGGEEPRNASVKVSITVTSSVAKPPSFVEPVVARISINESYTDVNELEKPIATFEAESNVADPEIELFELLRGKSAMTNSEATFKLSQKGNRAFLYRLLVNYEAVPMYYLTIRVRNKQGGEAETVLQVDVVDNNDEWPRFTDLEGGTVLENSPANTLVATVKATDPDGTFPNNQVQYRLVGDYVDKFQIDNHTGEIRTRVPLDREQMKKYALFVEAYDGAISFKSKSEPNSVQEKIIITVGDVNDNAPVFPQELYKVDVAEDRDMGAKVSELKAVDPDSDSVLTYEIIGGNVDNVFRIVTTEKSNTATLEVNRSGGLDYEKNKFYKLTVEVDDGQQKATTVVEVSIINVNDNEPEFLIQDKTIRGIMENTVPVNPIITIRARDPDYDPSVMDEPEKIKFSISTGLYSDNFRIEQNGELFLIRPLDRDAPLGHKEWTVTVLAEDSLNGKELDNTLELSIMLEDENDNAPFLDMVQPVVWYENQGPASITELKATDYDEEKNGAPFTMKLADSAEPAVRSSFQIEGSPLGGWHLKALREFDREYRKNYLIPIVIADNGVPKQSATSMLNVVIGDRNDNPMTNGTSSILVYNYKDSLPDTVIGRVYVQDADDWDLPDKTFAFLDDEPSDFLVAPVGGYITVKAHVQDGVYPLKFMVQDRVRQETAVGTVVVTVKAIPEEAVRLSGSLRMSGISQEGFIEPPVDGTSLSPRDKLRKKLTEIVGAIEENIDIFTIFDVPLGNGSIDVRFSAHGSPYYSPVKLDGLTADHRPQLEKLLGVKVEMFGVDECRYEEEEKKKKSGSCDGSCTNRMHISDQPYSVATNTSSFIGVLASIEAECVCKTEEYLTAPCHQLGCFNGGSCTGDAGQPCQCPAGLSGPRCEGLEVSFDGSGWAWYDPLPTCTSGSLSFSLLSRLDSGVMVYAGPRALPPDTSITDYMAVELVDGSPVLYIDLGSGTQRLALADASRSLVDGKVHNVHVSWNKRNVQMRIDECQGGQTWCLVASALVGDHQFLNVKGPLQVGGVSADLEKLSSRLRWLHAPSGAGFAGCIQNLTFNDQLYNLYGPAHYKNATSSCAGMPLPVTAGGFGIELIIILIVCLLILVVLILSVLAYKKRNRHDNLKEFNDDIRENIINYSDEGGGEGDMTGYDLSVLRMTPDGKPLIGKNDDYGTLLHKDMEMQQRHAVQGDVPEISQFLDDNKGRVDRDPDCLAYDDLRHYAYEGDGNSGGSLSSLISGSDDADLDFDYLSEFGPRFKKLADIYGHHSSESEDDGGESWC